MASSDLTPVEDAISHMLGKARQVTDTEVVALSHCLDRILAKDYRVPADVPPADNSSVDGYAIRAADLSGQQPLPVSGRIAAGKAPGSCRPGSAVHFHWRGNPRRCRRGGHAGAGHRGRGWPHYHR